MKTKLFYYLHFFNKISEEIQWNRQIDISIKIVSTELSSIEFLCISSWEKSEPIFVYHLGGIIGIFAYYSWINRPVGGRSRAPPVIGFLWRKLKWLMTSSTIWWLSHTWIWYPPANFSPSGGGRRGTERRKISFSQSVSQSVTCHAVSPPPGVRPGPGEQQHGLRLALALNWDLYRDRQRARPTRIGWV